MTDRHASRPTITEPGLRRGQLQHVTPEHREPYRNTDLIPQPALGQQEEFVGTRGIDEAEAGSNPEAVRRSGCEWEITPVAGVCG
ncbi:MAG: hypothetical protein ACRDS1_17020 [Pseudonocardiaceae bacterium]